MLAKRIIPCLDVKDNRVVKGVQFVNLRDAGDPVELGDRYSEEGADELVFLDITATIRSRKTIVELVENAAFYARNRPMELNEKAIKLLSGDGPDRLAGFRAILAETEDWSAAGLEEKARAFSEKEGCKLGQVAGPLRAALAGSNTSPGMFEVMEILGKEETLGRIDDALLSTGITKK